MMFNSPSNPFVGLRPFESSESLLFFGRQDQTLELLQRLHRYHFVAVTGGSGSGKSSLIKAGLIPRLKAGYLVNDSDRWLISAMKPGQSPLYNLANAILTHSGPVEPGTATWLKEKIEEEGMDAVFNVLQPLWSNESNLFLLIDQFEELFRFSLNGKDIDKKEEAIDFVNILLELSKQRELPVYVVITMRSDFIGDCAQFYGLPEAMNQSQYIVPRLNRIQLETTIEGPVRLYDGKINPALTARLMNDAQLVKDELPLLQHVLMRIWDHKNSIHSNGTLDLEDYKAVGGIEKALSNHADEALQGISEAELNLTKKIFQALTAVDENGRKIRRPVRISELEAVSGADRDKILSIINRFIEGNKSFLVIDKSGDTSDLLIDISHESLIRQWTTLNTWVDEEAESGKIFLRLSESATLYSEKKKDLLSGNELHQILQWYYSFQPVEAWAQRYSTGYKNNIEYLRQSEKEEKKQRAKKLRNRNLLLAALIFIIIVISGFAFKIYKNNIVIHKNNIENEKALALNYWTSSQYARSDNNLLDALHLIVEATKFSNDDELTENLLIDGEACLPGTCLKNILPQTVIINSVVFSADGEQILIAGNDGSARIVDKMTGNQIGRGMKHNLPVNSAVFSADGKWVLTAGNDNTARIWNTATGNQIASFQHTGPVNDAVFSPDGKKILTACSDSTARMWSVATGEPTALFKHEGVVTGAVFSPDAKWILTSSQDLTVRIWDAASKKQIGSLNTKTIVTNAIFSPDAKWILTCGRDSIARIWEVATMKQTDSLKHGDAVTDAAFSPDGKLVLSSSADKTARLWDLSTKKQIGPAMKHEGPVYSVAFSADGKQVLTAGDKTVRLWDMPVKIEDKKISFRHGDIVTSAVFNPGGTRILSGGYDSVARIWDVASRKQIDTLKQSARISSAVFSPDGKNILTACYDSTVRVWDAATGKQLDSVKLADKATSAVFSSNGKLILATCRDNYLRIWKAGTKLKTEPGNSFRFQATVTSAVFSADEGTILIAGMDSSAYLLDATSWKQVWVYKHDNIVTGAVFSPDGNSVLTASRDKTARLWSVVTGKQTGPSMKHDSYVNSAAFSPGGKWIVTAGWDGAAHLWNTANLKEIGVAKKSAGALTSAVFSPDGKWILTAGYDSTAQLWDIGGDLDLPASLFELQARATTGVEYNIETSETRCILPQTWVALKEEYNKQAREHYKICKYPQYSLWRSFNKEEAEKIRPNE